MNNSSPTSETRSMDPRNKEEQSEEYSERKMEEMEKSMIPVVAEKDGTINKEEEIINEVEKFDKDSMKNVDEDSSSTVEQGCESNVEKPSKDHGETVNLMQDKKDSSFLLMNYRVTNDSAKVKENIIIRKQINPARSISWSILRRRRNDSISRNILRSITRKTQKLNASTLTLRILNHSKLAIKVDAESSFKLKKKPIPTKEWAWIYRRRLIRQDAFYGSWPEL